MYKGPRYSFVFDFSYSLKMYSLSKHSLSNRDNGDFIGYCLAHADISFKQKHPNVYTGGIWPAGGLYWIIKYKIKAFVTVAFNVKLYRKYWVNE